jgi:hypothetical protein
MWRKRNNYVERRTDVGSFMAWLFVLTLIAALFWMGVTRNRFCCDPKSLVGQLRKQLFVTTSLNTVVTPRRPGPKSRDNLN